MRNEDGFWIPLDLVSLVLGLRYIWSAESG
jgi:hypothetical protein